MMRDIGVLQVGRRANLAVLDDNPTTVDPTTIGRIRVLETWVDGERVHAA
jgi:predicted amidohydrolase YtcJ